MTLTEELAEARLALSRRLEDLAARPELLLGRSPEELLGDLVGAYRASLRQIAYTPQVVEGAAIRSEATPEALPTPADPPDEPEGPHVVDLREVVPSIAEREQPRLLEVDVGHGAKALLSPESVALIRDLPELVRTFRDLHAVGTADMLQRAVGERITGGLPGLDDEVMTDLVHLLVALLRHAGERATQPDDSARLTSSLFRTLRFDYTEERRLYIHGMALAHTPKRGLTWSDDATYWLNQLEARVEAVDPESMNETPSGSGSRSRDGRSPPKASISWPSTFGWSGRSIELLGANHNPELRDELLEISGAKRIEWTPLQRGSPNMRLVQTLCERIERGSVDLAVIFTAFATHKATQRLKKSLQRAPHVRALWMNGVPSTRNLRDALLEHPEAHV